MKIRDTFNDEWLTVISCGSGGGRHRADLAFTPIDCLLFSLLKFDNFDNFDTLYSCGHPSVLLFTDICVVVTQGKLKLAESRETATE
jgi:hypothetical protein